MLFLLAQPLPIVPEVDKPFMSGEGERRQSRICRSAIRRKKFPTQGRGYSIGIPKNLYVYHFRCFPCLFRSPLEFVNLTPTLLNFSKLHVSLKDLALEWTCMASWKTRVKLLQVAFVRLSGKTSKQSGPPPFEGVVWVIFKNIHPANWFQGEKMLQENTWPKKILKNKTASGYRPGGGGGGGLP